MGMFRKKGGGFLNGVSGTILGYKFDSKAFEGKKGEYHALSVELSILPDGAKAAVPQFVPAGFFYPDTQTISDDKQEIETEDSGVVAPDSEFGRFMESLLACDDAPAEDDFDADGRSFTPLNGLRVTFAKEINTERQMAAGRKALGSRAAKSTDEEIMAAGKRKDKKDKSKSYNQDRLIVTRVLGTLSEKELAAARKGKGAPAAAKDEKPAKGKAAKGKSTDGISDDRADEVLTAIVGESKSKSVEQTKLGSIIVRYALGNDIETAERDALRVKLADADYIADAVERGVIEVTKGVITIPE